MPKPKPIQSSARPRPPLLTTKNLSILVTGAVLIVALLKADSKDIPKIVETLTTSNTFAIVGWVLAAVFLLGSSIFIWLLVRFYGREMTRLAAERDSLQSRLLNDNQ